MRIDVTEDDLARGVSRTYAIARAIRRAWGRPCYVYVFSDRTAVYVTRAPVYYAEFPEAVQQFIAAFNDGEPADPFTFDLTWSTHANHSDG